MQGPLQGSEEHLPGLRGKDLESSVNSATEDTSPDMIIKIVRAIAKAKTFYCPLCLGRAGQPIPVSKSQFTVHGNAQKPL